jgi:hypothetical protein
MKLLNLLKTTLKPTSERQVEKVSYQPPKKVLTEAWWPAMSPTSPKTRQLQEIKQLKEWRAHTSVSEPTAQTRPQSEALKNLLKRADVIGSTH